MSALIKQLDIARRYGDLSDIAFHFASYWAGLTQLRATRCGLPPHWSASGQALAMSVFICPTKPTAAC